MSAAYERVRAALVGTDLEGELDRLNAELHLTPDAPEWTLAALTFVGGAALRYRLDKAQATITELLNDLPDAMKSSAVVIVHGLAAEIAGKTVTQVSGSLAAARKRERSEDAVRIDVLMREAQTTQALCRRAIGDVQSAANEVATKAIAHADQIATQVQRMTESAQIAAFAIIAAILLGGVGAGTAGALIERHLDHETTYLHGWEDGAAAVRAHLRRNGTSS